MSIRLQNLQYILDLIITVTDSKVCVCVTLEASKITHFRSIGTYPLRKVREGNGKIWV